MTMINKLMKAPVTPTEPPHFSSRQLLCFARMEKQQINHGFLLPDGQGKVRQWLKRSPALWCCVSGLSVWREILMDCRIGEGGAAHAKSLHGGWKAAVSHRRRARWSLVFQCVAGGSSSSTPSPSASLELMMVSPKLGSLNSMKLLQSTLRSCKVCLRRICFRRQSLVLHTCVCMASAQQ